MSREHFCNKLQSKVVVGINNVFIFTGRQKREIPTMAHDREHKRRTPSIAAIRKVVDAARAAGLDVASIEVIDNAIHVFDARVTSPVVQSSDEFTKWDMEGRL